MMPGPNEYTPQELRSMQREAIRRVQEMQRRSRQTVQQNRSAPSPRPGSPPPQNQSQSAPQREPMPHPTEEPAAQAEKTREESAAPAHGERDSAAGPSPELPPFPTEQTVQMKNPISTLLDAFHIDHDRMMILFVLLMVLDSGTDPSLLLALVYLLF